MGGAKEQERDGVIVRSLSGGVQCVLFNLLLQKFARLASGISRFETVRERTDTKVLKVYIQPTQQAGWPGRHILSD